MKQKIKNVVLQQGTLQLYLPDERLFHNRFA
jgi:hypothetical protein